MVGSIADLPTLSSLMLTDILEVGLIAPRFARWVN